MHPVPEVQLAPTMGRDEGSLHAVHEIQARLRTVKSEWLAGALI
jgi:hypothetical protein